MNEQDYIDVSNLSKLRIASLILGDLIASDNVDAKELREARKKVSRMREIVEQDVAQKIPS